MIIKGLIIAAVIAYAIALLGFASALIAEMAIEDKEKKAKAEKIKFYLLFIVCLPYWIYKKIKQKS